MNCSITISGRKTGQRRSTLNSTGEYMEILLPERNLGDGVRRILLWLSFV